MSAVGLLGGTFDPIHDGHLDVARAARQALGLDEVWLIPARQPPHRDGPTASAAHRFAMVALVVADHPWLRACDAEMERAGPSFTIDTLDLLERRHPDSRGRFVFVTGVDAFREIRTWRRWEDLLDRCHFAVVSRQGAPAGELRNVLPELSGRMRESSAPLAAPAGIYLVDARTAPVSSTGVREALAAQGRLDGLLPRAVAEYALRHRLYATPPVLEAPQG